MANPKIYRLPLHLIVDLFLLTLLFGGLLASFLVVTKIVAARNQTEAPSTNCLDAAPDRDIRPTDSETVLCGQ